MLTPAELKALPPGLYHVRKDTVTVLLRLLPSGGWVEAERGEEIFTLANPSTGYFCAIQHADAFTRIGD